MNQKLQEKVNIAHAEIGWLCKSGGKSWHIGSTKAENDDSDVVLLDTLAALVAEIERLEAEQKVVYNFTINNQFTNPDFSSIKAVEKAALLATGGKSSSEVLEAMGLEVPRD